MRSTAIVVVTYCSEEDIVPCLRAAVKTGAPVTVVDNASSDATCDRVRAVAGVRLIANQENRGFAAAVNQAVRATDAGRILLLNPDTVLLDPLDGLEAALDEEGVAAAGGCLLGEDGEPQAGFAVRRFPTTAALAFEVLGLNRLWPSNPVNRRYRCLDLDLRQPASNVQPPGAFLMFRRSVWQRLGGFDEQYYPVWFEEVDFLARALGEGGAVRYVPGVRARHLGGRSVGQVPRETRQMYWYANLLKYAHRHFCAMPFRTICVALIAGSLVRAVAESLARRNLGPFMLYGRVLRLAVGGLFRGRPACSMPASAAASPGV